MIAVKTSAVNSTMASMGMTEWLSLNVPDAKMRMLFEPNGNLSRECEILFTTRADAMRFKLIWG